MKKLILSAVVFLLALHSSSFASLTDGLVAYWSFDATNAVDNSGNGHDGTIHGAPTPVAGMFGSAYNFNGSSDWIDAPHSSAFDLTNNLTIGAWVNYTSVNSSLGAQILWYGDTVPATDPWSLKLLQGGIAEFRIDAGTGFTLLTLTTNSLAAGTWYFLAGTESSVGDAKTLKFYLNGLWVGTLVTNAPVTYNLSSMQVNIGSVDNGGLELFNGKIDEAFVYNRELTDVEIQQIYSTGIPEPTSVELALSGLVMLGWALRRRIVS